MQDFIITKVKKKKMIDIVSFYTVEIKAVAALLGVSGVALYRGFTTKTRNTRGQVCKSLADVNTVSIA